jgi:hypothetical protein
LLLRERLLRRLTGRLLGGRESLSRRGLARLKHCAAGNAELRAVLILGSA